MPGGSPGGVLEAGEGVSMRPEDFFDLSHYLAIRLEESIQGPAEEPAIPVYLAHPLDIPQAESGDSPRAALYLHQIMPSATCREAGLRIHPAADPSLPGRLSRGDLWLELRFIFMIIEANPREEMGAMAAASGFLYSNALLPVAEMETRLEKELAIETGELPLEVVEDTGVWRELGLDRHHLGISFKVTLPMASRPAEVVERVVEREVSLERVLKEEGE